MTTTATPERLILNASQTDTVQRVLDEISDDAVELQVLNTSGTQPMPAEMVNLLRQVLETVARGGSIVIGSLPDELTTSVAAQQLGISRQALMKMIQSGKIPAHKVGSHHRLLAKDVLDARRARQEREREAALKLLEMGED
ncbi:excisionase family DNA-binding protein [Luteococcus sanguinis]|uniref:Excisionase family DNA-binding protein n=1 Tax=Luteococcus sanguinis TaxID=174038 RepID=A0ABW1WWY7_9ACTN